MWRVRVGSGSRHAVGRGDQPCVPDEPNPAIDDIWREQRRFLLDVAYRMVGSVSDAEDIVQEAFARLLRVDTAEIDDVRAWLVVVVSREPHLTTTETSGAVRRRAATSVSSARTSTGAASGSSAPI